MYALENIKKFVEDNAEQLGDQAEGILKRAENASFDGILSGSSIDEIMGDEALAREFRDVVMIREHVEVGLRAMSAMALSGSNIQRE